MSRSEAEKSSEYSETDGQQELDNTQLGIHYKSRQLFAALFYGIASFMIMIINKQVLTHHNFNAFQVLAIGQMVSTIATLYLARSLQWITFPKFSSSIIASTWPLPMFYAGNMIFGLGGTQALSLPMLTVLRRFSILMTLLGEYYLLKVIPSVGIKLSVFLMIFGAIVAAANDMAFNLPGYIFVLMNDFCTAGTGVVIKSKLNKNELGKYGLMYYNALISLVPATLIAFYTGDIDKAYNFPGWSKSPQFVFLFFLSCTFGVVLMYSIMLCTSYNSALTTSIVGTLKNMVITYYGILFSPDYIFSALNFTGLIISSVGTVIYTKTTFSQKKGTSEASIETKRLKQ